MTSAIARYDVCCGRSTPFLFVAVSEARVPCAVRAGLCEILCAAGVKLLRRTIPKAAMMSALGGVAITFISMPFMFDIFQTVRRYQH